MEFLRVFEKQEELINMYGKGNAYLLWTIGLYLDYPDLDQLENENLTDRKGDRKIDFIRIDKDLKKIIICQGYFSKAKNMKEIAPANKASDLNTAAAWLIDGNLLTVPEKLREIILECREAIDNKEIERIELLYVHNCAESKNVEQELATANSYLAGRVKHKDIGVIHKELGVQNIEKLFLAMQQSLIVTDEIKCLTNVKHKDSGPNWKSIVTTISGDWLWEQFHKYGDDLFSTNYRGFLGISKRRKINSGIRRTAENKPHNFLVYNNGITILTSKYKPIFEGDNQIGITLSGMSIINGAQTTGSIGSVDNKEKLENVKVLCRIIETSDPETIKEIVKFNNTQNVITTWDQYGNDSGQKRIKEELTALGHEYSLKRGFSNISSKMGIEIVAQPLVSLHGDYSAANKGKNHIFETKTLYTNAFENEKGRHIIFAYTLKKAIDAIYGNLKDKDSLTEIEKKQISLLRNLKAKNFLIALVGENLEAILGKKCDKHNVMFTYDVSLAKNNSLDDLIDKWVPILKLVIASVANLLEEDLTDYLRSANPLEKLSKNLATILYSMNATIAVPEFKEFSDMVQSIE